MKFEDWKEKYGANSMWANQIFDGEKLYDLDEDKKEAVYYVYEDTIKPIWEYQKRFDSVIKESNFIGKEKIAGEECKIYELETNDGYVKIWLWNNIILKGIERAKDSGGSIEETWEAVKIEKNLTFEDNLFTLPQGYTAISQEEYRSREDVQELESMFEEIDKAQQENSE